MDGPFPLRIHREHVPALPERPVARAQALTGRRAGGIVRGAMSAVPSVPVTAGPRILIVRLGAVGDVVRALPLAHALRAAHPDATLGWLVEEPSAPLLRAIACLDAVHVFERRALVRALPRPARWRAVARSLADLRGALRRAAYDVVLDVHGTLKAGLLASVPQVPITGLAPGGSKEGAHHFYATTLPFPARPMGRVERALYLGAAAGLTPPVPSERADFGLRFDRARVHRALEFLASDPRRPVVLFPFASAKGQAKRWPLARHAELGALLAGDGHRVVLAWGSPAEGEQARAAALPGIELAPATDLVELTEILRGASLLVTGDTGPMHLAAAVGTPVLALFGPSDVAINQPWRGEAGGHRVIARRPLTALGVEEVAEAARAMLATPARD